MADVKRRLSWAWDNLAEGWHHLSAGRRSVLTSGKNSFRSNHDV